VIFCGSGATAAVSKLIGILELRLLAAPAAGPDPARAAAGGVRRSCRWRWPGC